MPTTTYLFDADGRDREVILQSSDLETLGDHQLLWVDLVTDDFDEWLEASALLRLPPVLNDIIYRRLKKDGHEPARPRLDVYDTCFHLNVEAVQDRNNSADEDAPPPKAKVRARPSSAVSVVAVPVFKIITVDFVVLPNLLVTLHTEPAGFLTSFDRRIKGDSHLGSLDGPAFLGALLSFHVTGYFRAMETLEAEVDRIDDDALRLRRGAEERDLLADMVKVRRRLALVRRALLPHREIYATLARPRFAAFVSEEATDTLRLMYDRMERAVETTENGRELILGSFDIFTTQAALRTNEVVKVLTVISALLLPAGVIATLSALFIRAPVYDLGKAGFWGLIIGIPVIGVLVYFVARRRNWL